MSVNFKSLKKKSQDEDKKKKKYKKIFTNLLENNPITGPSTRIINLIKGELAKKGELTKEKEFSIEELLKDLREEQKEAANKNNPSKETNKKKRNFQNYQKLRSSKDKKFQGHTGRGD